MHLGVVSLKHNGGLKKLEFATVPKSQNVQLCAYVPATEMLSISS